MGLGCSFSGSLTLLHVGGRHGDSYNATAVRIRPGEDGEEDDGGAVKTDHSITPSLPCALYVRKSKVYTALVAIKIIDSGLDQLYPKPTEMRRVPFLSGGVTRLEFRNRLRFYEGQSRLIP